MSREDVEGRQRGSGSGLDVSENVEMVRRAYEVGYAARSVEVLRETFAEDFLFHTRPEFPGGGAYGIDALTELWADLDDTYSEFSLVPVDYTAIGHHVLVTLRQSTRLRGSDARLENTIYHLVRINDGKVAEAWTYVDRERALEAVGPPE
jgi:ketosteroid isomerase-like protein